MVTVTLQQQQIMQNNTIPNCVILNLNSTPKFKFNPSKFKFNPTHATLRTYTSYWKKLTSHTMEDATHMHIRLEDWKINPQGAAKCHAGYVRNVPK
jgi:hypothetical protein